MFAGARRRNDLISMQRMRRRQDDRFDFGIGEHFIEVSAERKVMLRSKRLRLGDFFGDPAHESQARAFALNSVDDVLAPPTETDDCGVDHELLLSKSLRILPERRHRKKVSIAMAFGHNRESSATPDAP